MYSSMFTLVAGRKVPLILVREDGQLDEVRGRRDTDSSLLRISGQSRHLPDYLVPHKRTEDFYWGIRNKTLTVAADDVSRLAFLNPSIV